MAYFFVNTDAKSLGGRSPHDEWIKQGHAFSGGPIKFGERFRRLTQEDIVFMWVNGIGVVAVGRVAEHWDEVTYSDPLVYIEPYRDEEYRIKVDWFIDLRDNPIPTAKIKKTFGSNPRWSLQKIRQDEATVENFINSYILNK